jgi:hypothetical protein
MPWLSYTSPKFRDRCFRGQHEPTSCGRQAAAVPIRTRHLSRTLGATKSAQYDSLFSYACGDQDYLTDDKLSDVDSMNIFISTWRLQLLPHHCALYHKVYEQLLGAS